jgi:hypothetical protein
MFIQHSSITSAEVGKPMCLHRGNIDPATLKLTFIYFEYAQEGNIWRYVQDEEPLMLNKHFRLDKRKGIIELLDHPLWKQEGHWRAADRVEPLLYKGQVKWPQVILFEYEHYAPEEVEQSKYKEEVDLEAKARLSYNVPKYAIKESMPTAVFDWEKTDVRR